MSGFMLYFCGACGVVVADPVEAAKLQTWDLDLAITREEFYARCPVCRDTRLMICLNKNLE